MRGIGRSNLILYDVTLEKKLPRFSSESSALHCINGSSDVRQQCPEESDNF